MRVSSLVLGAFVHANEDAGDDIIYTGCQAVALRSQPGWENVELKTDGSKCVAGKGRAVTTSQRWDQHRNETTGKWIVPYYFSEGYENLSHGGHSGVDSMNGIRDHLRHFEELTCIQMKELTTSEDFNTYTNRIRVFWSTSESSNCASYIGRVFGGDQTMWMRPDCYTWNGGTTTNHEFMHALGFKHEHVRPDRDNHVVIHSSLASNGNYVKMSTSQWQDVSSPYDFNSILHYYSSWQGDGYSIGLPPDGQQAAPVSRTYPFSEQDIAQLRAVYPCDDVDPCDPNPCPSGQICSAGTTGQAVCKCPQGSVLNAAGGCQVVGGIVVEENSDVVNFAGIKVRRSPMVNIYDADGNDIDLGSNYDIAAVAEVEECGESMTDNNCTIWNNYGYFYGTSASMNYLTFGDEGNYRLRYFLDDNGQDSFPDAWVISDEYEVKSWYEAPGSIAWHRDHSTKHFGVPLNIEAALRDANGSVIDFGPGPRDIQACLWLAEPGTAGTLNAVDRNDLFYDCVSADQFGNFDLSNITLYEAEGARLHDYNNTAVPPGDYFFRLQVAVIDSWQHWDSWMLDKWNDDSIFDSGIFTLAPLCYEECHKNGFCNATATVFMTPDCQCNDGYEGDGVDYCIRVIDECAFGGVCPAGQICVDKLIGYDCVCEPGFVKHPALMGCVDVDECATAMHACNVGTSCENTDGGYLCNPDFTGVTCDPECEDGYFCDELTGTCEDVNECTAGTHDCKDFESCRNVKGKFICDFDNSQCRADLPRPEWKGRNGMRYVFESSTGAVMAMKLKNKFKKVNVRNELYTGVIMFTKDVCGVDFLRALQDGRVQIELVDSFALYQIHDFHYKNKQKYTAIGFTFDLLSVETKDMPWAFKSGVPTKNMGSDDVYISFTGLELVNWLTNQDNCLLLGAQAALPYEDFSELDRACFVDLKTFWQTPPLPNP
ncbi:Oidioi.mRNA.OKI2018_I69.PAR.g9936.t1.cds [Oikopleura dioica]|uniref:Metalloendopeptidase n=1 Tax=Oikopleura dioica TaxID=34765 RepID=A0ABN7RRL4_OIKDI|nr:Oidioi.mRNA.OKI2018_I69.PAR.g9936.t1.cds [Oikopleura dioica]